MIRFFRNIRLKLATENKIAAYLRYAVGEIVLVMVGILLALQVNNWNQERKNNSLRKSYIENLIADLKKDIENLESLNITNSNGEKEGFYLAEFLDDALTDIDTLRLTTSIVYSGYIPNSTIISSTYNDIINSDNIHLFNDVKLKRLLDDYYIRDNWAKLFNDRILKTAWYDYRDEMLKYHSPLLYRDFYTNSINMNNSSLYDVKWKSYEERYVPQNTGRNDCSIQNTDKE